MSWALAAAARELGLAGGPLGAPWPALGYADLVRLRAGLAARYAPATANLVLAAVRGVLREAWRLQLIPAEALARARDVRRVRGRRAPAGRALTATEIGALLAICRHDGTVAGLRDAAVVAVLVGTGLRRAELAALDLSDYDAGDSALAVRHGKGGKARRVWATPAREDLARWLAARGTRAGPLFPVVRGRGRLRWTRLTGDGVLKVLGRRARQAGLAQFSPHDLRRTWVSRMLESGADLALVQVLAGHASAATTAGYDRRPEQAQREAAARLTLPGG